MQQVEIWDILILPYKQNVGAPNHLGTLLNYCTVSSKDAETQNFPKLLCLIMIKISEYVKVSVSGGTFQPVLQVPPSD